MSSHNYNPGRLAPNFRFTMQNSITKKLALGYNIDAEWNGIDNKPAIIYTFAQGWSVSEKIYFYIEAFGAFITKASLQHSIDFGLAYTINNNNKVDVSGGLGVAHASPAWYVAIGYSTRYNMRK